MSCGRHCRSVRRAPRAACRRLCTVSCIGGMPCACGMPEGAPQVPFAMSRPIQQLSLFKSFKDHGRLDTVSAAETFAAAVGGRDGV